MSRSPLSRALIGENLGSPAHAGPYRPLSRPTALSASTVCGAGAATAHHLDGWRPDTGQLTARTHASITEIARDAWNGLFPGNPGSWDFYRAGERTSSPDFTYFVIAAYANDRLVGAVPMFRLDYRLDAPLGPWFQLAGDWMDRHAPDMIRMPVLCVGSPLTDECHIGTLPALCDQQRAEVLDALLREMSRFAAANRVRVLSLKDVSDDGKQWADPVLRRHRFSAVPSLPVATLDLPFADVDQYLASLSPKMRSDVRRKLRQAKSVRVEIRDSIAGLEDEIERLYQKTRDNRKASYEGFDDLPEDYFRQMMVGLRGRCRLLLCWVGDRLGLFNMFFVERERVLGKHLGMDYELSRTHNLYFVNWMATVRHCIDNGYSSLQVGQTSYGLKARLGCKLHRSWVYGKHTGVCRGPLFRALAPYAAFDRTDPDLRELGADAPYA